MHTCYVSLVYCLNRSYLSMVAIADGTVAISRSGSASFALAVGESASDSLPLVGIAIKALFAGGQYVLDKRKRSEADRIARRLGFGASQAELVCEEVSRTIALVERVGLSRQLKTFTPSKTGLKERFEHLAQAIKDDTSSPIDKVAIRRCEEILKKLAEAASKESSHPGSSSVDESVKWVLDCLSFKDSHVQQARDEAAKWVVSSVLPPLPPRPTAAAAPISTLPSTSAAIVATPVSAEEHQALKEQFEALKKSQEEEKRRNEQQMKEIREMLMKKADAEEKKDKDQSVEISGGSQAQLQARSESSAVGNSSVAGVFVQAQHFESHRADVAETLADHGTELSKAKEALARIEEQLAKPKKK